MSTWLLRVGESHNGQVGLGLRSIEASLLVLDERARNLRAGCTYASAHAPEIAGERPQHGFRGGWHLAERPSAMEGRPALMLPGAARARRRCSGRSPP